MAVGIRNPGANITRVLRLSVTGECNLNCFYCKPIGRAADLIRPKHAIQPSDVSKIVKIVGELGVRRVVIQGGEPLLRKDAANFVKSAYAHKGIEDVRLVTNGTFLKSFSDQLRKLGLRKVDINFDTLNFLKFQKITGSDSLYRVLDGIEKVERLNFTEVRLNVTLLPGVNEEEVINFSRMTKDRPLHVRFLEYNPVPKKGATNDAGTDRTFRVEEARRLIENYQVLNAMPFAPSTDELEIKSPSYKFVDGVGKISFISRSTLQSENGIPRVLLNAEGVLINEAMPNKSLPILESIRKGAKEVSLHKAMEKVMLLGPSPSLYSLKKPEKKSTPAKRSRMAEAHL